MSHWQAARFLSLDIGAFAGPFLFTLAFHVLFPVLVVSLVRTRPQKLRAHAR